MIWSRSLEVPCAWRVQILNAIFGFASSIILFTRAVCPHVAVDQIRQIGRPQTKSQDALQPCKRSYRLSGTTHTGFAGLVYLLAI